MSLNNYRIKTINEADFYYVPEFFDRIETSQIFESIKNESNWKQESLIFSGKSVEIPRLTSFYGSKEYRYSGLVNLPKKLPENIEWVSYLVNKFCLLHFFVDFNSVLLNYYRNGNDSISWHSDDETSLGTNPFVASISLGHPRLFKLRNKETKIVTDLCLEDGSLLFMGNNSQTLFEHCVPKTKNFCGERINLTFRKIL
ncbi:MAG TPA: alpha-ketoglutarate-dependent dioxygenase AlkB [Leptospiraceae bacterium]|nr:alpha-ketoglutarate-dependent dioxygenase AlkB [Leptospiraceae bacterium]